MNLEKIKKKYGLKNDVDMWLHQQSRKYIIKHDTIEKIASQENIKIIKIECLNSSIELVRFLISMGQIDAEGKVINAVTTVGEADKNNCTSRYIGCMAEKRGIDRAVLKILGLYDEAMSEIEADDFDFKNKDVVNLATQKQKDYLMKLCADKGIDNSEWDFDKMNRDEASSKIDKIIGGSK